MPKISIAEKSMRNFMEHCNCLEDCTFYDQMVMGKLNDKLNVRISLNGGISADNRYGLLVEVINKEIGRIDAQTYDFSKIIGKIKLANGDTTTYRLWKGTGGEFEWYAGEPNATQRKKIMSYICEYLALYK